MGYLKMAVAICIVILGLAGIAAGLMLLNKPSNLYPLLGVFVVLGSIGIPLWVLKLIYWRKHEVKAATGGPVPISDSHNASVREPD